MNTMYPEARECSSQNGERKPPKLLDRLRHALRVKHYAYRTEQAYVQWVKRFILYHGKRHPEEMGKPEIENFLTHLAVEGQVSASTQTQALCGILGTEKVSGTFV